MSKLTIRQRMNRDKRWCILVAWAALACFLYSMLVLQNERIGIVILVVFGLCIVTGLVSVRCPRCRTAWGALVMNSGTVFSISRKVVVCPFCRSEVDLPPDDPAQPELD